MSDLEKELKEKIRQAREAQLSEEPPVEEEVEEDVDDLEESEEVEPDEIEEVEEEADEIEEEEPKSKKAKNAFQRMRQELKERDDAINEMRREMARLQGAQEAMLKPKEEPAPVEEIPDRDLEPEAYNDYQLKLRDKRIEELSAQFDTINRTAAVSKAESTYIGLENDYISKDPSYKDAKSFYISERTRALKEQYPAASDADIAQEVKGEEYRIVESLAKAGLSTDAIFNTIKAQSIALGFKDVPAAKRDNKKLKHNMSKSASLNDAPTASGDIGFSESQLRRMGSSFSEIAKLAGDKGSMKKAHDALRRARLKAMS